MFGELKGIIESLCMSKIYFLQVERFRLLDKLEAYPLKVRLTEQEDIIEGLSEAELNMHIDLRPFMQRTPFIVQVSSTSSCANLEVQIASECAQMIPAYHFYELLEFECSWPVGISLHLFGHVEPHSIVLAMRKLGWILPRDGLQNSFPISGQCKYGKGIQAFQNNGASSFACWTCKASSHGHYHKKGSHLRLSHRYSSDMSIHSEALILLKSSMLLCWSLPLQNFKLKYSRGSGCQHPRMLWVEILTMTPLICLFLQNTDWSEVQSSFWERSTAAW